MRAAWSVLMLGAALGCDPTPVAPAPAPKVEDTAEAKKQRLGALLEEAAARREVTGKDLVDDEFDPGRGFGATKAGQEMKALLLAIAGEDPAAQLAAMEEVTDRYAPRARKRRTEGFIAAAEQAVVSELLNIRLAQERFRYEYGSYWVADVSGLHRLHNNSTYISLRLISSALARADARPLVSMEEEGRAPGFLGVLIAFGKPKAALGYRYSALAEREESPGKWTVLDSGTALNAAAWAVAAWPETYGETGRHVFMTSQDGRVWKKDLAGARPRGLPLDPAAEGWSPVQ